MSEAKISFEYGIQDAEDLLGHFDAINKKPPPERAEVLKRAGLVMALTAWETYVEEWANTDSARARKLLNQWISKRGDAVHRSKPVNNGSPVPHLIKRDELAKAIRFIKELVKATDAYLDANL